jgi:hypothetical protein
MEAEDYVNANIAEWEEAQLIRYKFGPHANKVNQLRLKLSYTGKEPVAIHGLIALVRRLKARG